MSDSQNPLPAPRFWWKRWAFVILGVWLIGGGVALGAIWMDNPESTILGIACIAAIIGGVWLVYSRLRAPTPTGSVIVATGGPTGGRKSTANSLNIYVKKDEDTGDVVPDRVVFEDMAKPMGQPQHCLNDNKWYHVHIWDLEKRSLRAFSLPDAQYSDPAILARYLEQPAQKRYLRHRPSLLRFVGPGILALMVGLGFILLVILSDTGGSV
jgi:hypothetical protein